MPVQFCFMTYFVYFTVVRDDVINVSLANYENKIERSMQGICRAAG